MVAGEDAMEDGRSWLDAEMAKLDFFRTDCSGIFRTNKGKLHSHYWNEPPAVLSRQQAKEYLDALIVELAKCEYCKG